MGKYLKIVYRMSEIYNKINIIVSLESLFCERMCRYISYL